MQLNHKFKTYCPDTAGLFVGMITKEGEFNPESCSVSTYMRAVIKQADKQIAWDSGKYVGDGFEVFVEALIHTMGFHPDVGIVNYKPQDGVDMGVDGYGEGHDGKQATVQAKYRLNPTEKLTAGKDRLDSFVVESLLGDAKGGRRVAMDGPSNMLVVTTAKELHRVTKEDKFKNKVRCLGIEHIDCLTKGNVAFWKAFYKAMN